MSKIAIIVVDYANEKHAGDLVGLLNHYACDPMGGGKPLAEKVKNNLTMELAKIPSAFSILCYIEGKPAGLINCFQGFSTFQCQPLINIHDIIVHRDFRTQGICQRMLEKIDCIALERGCCKVTLEVLACNEIAKKAYSKFGFRPYSLGNDSGGTLFWQKSLTDFD